MKKIQWNKEAVLRFLDKQGFYIVLFVCALVVAGTALFTTDSGQALIARMQGKSPEVVENDQPTAPYSGDLDENRITLEEPYTAAGVSEQETVEQAVRTARTTNSPVPSPTIPPTPVPATPIPMIMEWPVTGQIGMGYSMEELVYCATLDQWTTHSGIDILAAAGTPVLCALDGVVAEVREDTALGYLILVDHGQWKTMYASLKETGSTQPGQKVKQGQVLGQVGLSAAFEAEEAPHLHFEVFCDGLSQNPESVLVTSGS